MTYCSSSMRYKRILLQVRLLPQMVSALLLLLWLLQPFPPLCPLAGSVGAARAILLQVRLLPQMVSALLLLLWLLQPFPPLCPLAVSVGAARARRVPLAARHGHSKRRASSARIA
jgi:hypothetical protein